MAVFCLIALVCNLGYSLFVLRRYKREYAIDAEDFKSSVFSAVTNVLTSYIVSNQHSKVDSDFGVSSLPSIKPLYGSFYQDIWGRGHFLVDGYDLIEGDFFDNGVILQLTEKGFYLQCGNVLTFYKFAGLRPASALPVGQDAEKGADVI